MSGNYYVGPTIPNRVNVENPRDYRRIDETQYSHTDVYTPVYTEGQIFGELSTYLPNSNPLKNALLWIQSIIGLWCLAWTIIFTILIFDHDWIRNWDALLGYVIGYAVIIVVTQGLALWKYMLNNDLNKTYQIPSDCTNFNRASHFMGHAHTQVLVLSYIVTVVTGAFSVWVYWSWLCKYKSACTYGDSAYTPNPLIVSEFMVYKVVVAFSSLLNLISLIFIIRAVYVHIRPLRSLNHLIKGVPVGPILLANQDNTVSLHTGYHPQ
jgi:hypothetical protein